MTGSRETDKQKVADLRGQRTSVQLSAEGGSTRCRAGVLSGSVGSPEGPGKQTQLAAQMLPLPVLCRLYCILVFKIFSVKVYFVSSLVVKEVKW